MNRGEARVSPTSRACLYLWGWRGSTKRGALEINYRQHQDQEKAHKKENQAHGFIKASSAAGTADPAIYHPYSSSWGGASRGRPPQAPPAGAPSGSPRACLRPALLRLPVPLPGGPVRKTCLAMAAGPAPHRETPPSHRPRPASAPPPPQHGAGRAPAAWDGRPGNGGARGGAGAWRCPALGLALPWRLPEGRCCLRVGERWNGRKLISDTFF